MPVFFFFFHEKCPKGMMHRSQNFGKLIESRKFFSLLLFSSGLLKEFGHLFPSVTKCRKET